MRNILLFLLLVLPVAAFQQSHLVFDLPNWQVSEQRMDVQSFVKGTFYVEVRVTLKEYGDILTPKEIVGAKVLSSRKVGQVNETAFEMQETLYILASMPYDKELYVITFVGKPDELKAAQKELEKLYATFTFAAEQRFVQAEWEKQLPAPKQLSMSQRINIPWGWIIFSVSIVGAIVIIGRKVLHRKKTKH